MRRTAIELEVLNPTEVRRVDARTTWLGTLTAARRDDYGPDPLPHDLLPSIVLIVAEPNLDHLTSKRQWEDEHA